jgi:hypothetical protein
MPDQLNTHRASLLQSKLYAAGPVFVQNVQWQYENTGHVLVDTSTHSNAVAAVVGRVLEHWLCCGPNGNYLDSDTNFGTLATAKFQLQLGKPIGTVFAADWDKAMETFNRVQSQVAATADHCNFIIPDGTNKNLRFSRKIFEKRVHLHHDYIVIFY